MAIRLGKTELKWVRTIHVDDGRFMVEHHVVGQASSVFQDVGRKPVTMLVEGLILGENALDSVEQIRDAHLNSKPLQFAADVTTGSDFTEVLIDFFQVNQVAGHRHRYEYTLKLREYTEPPEPATAGLAEVDAGIADTADAWASDSGIVAGTLQDPSAVPGVLAERPDLVGQMDMSDLGQAITDGVADLSGSDFGGILQAVGSLDPEALGELLSAVKDGGSLGDIIGKLAKEGLDLVEELTGLELGDIASLVESIAGSADLLKQLEEIGSELVGLIADLKDFDPLGPLRELK